MSIAVWPADAVISLIRALPRPPLPGVHWSPPERWIVKVRPLGHVPAEVVVPLLEERRDELDGAPAVECRLGPAPPRPGGQWLYVPVRGLEEIGAAVFE